MAFGTNGRRRQSDFRRLSPTISNNGRCPTDDKGQRHGHLLALGYEVENLMPSLRSKGGAQDFFADRDIKWWKSLRSGDDCAVAGPTRNLASSQICCVNFLLPLANVPGALAELLRVIDSDVVDVVPICHNGLCTPVEFEWIGSTGSLEGSACTRGANVTSADAFAIGKTDRGISRGYLFEWKYVEDYKIGEYKGSGSAGNTRFSRYLPLYHATDSPFNGSVLFEHLLYEPFYQLMRFHLLARKMILTKEFGIAEAKVVVVCPNDNIEYRNRVTSPPIAVGCTSSSSVEAVMKSALKDPSMFEIVSQETLTSALRNSGLSHDLDLWFDYHALRYGW